MTSTDHQKAPHRGAADELRATLALPLVDVLAAVGSPLGTQGKDVT
jgi:hypothetical protein